MFRRTSYKGFTIVELVIIVVVVAILGALVFNAIVGVQKSARDKQRQSDVGNIAKSLESFYEKNSSYPIAASLTPSAISGLKAEYLQPPKSSAESLPIPQSAAEPISKPTNNDPQNPQEVYLYVPLNGTKLCTSAPCTSFTIYYWEESSDTIKRHDSTNQ